jgi:four helix bundle protein
MQDKFDSFEDLRIWQESMRLTGKVYSAFKSCRDFGLKDQMQRSVVSIPSNIAEGFELNTNRAFIRHLYIAKGSCGELRTQFVIASQQGYIDSQKSFELIDLAMKVSSMISKFIDERKKMIRKN